MKTNESKESLSVISTFNLQGEVGPEGPAGPRVSYDWQTYKDILQILACGDFQHNVQFLIIVFMIIFTHLIGATRSYWGARKG